MAQLNDDLLVAKLYELALTGSDKDNQMNAIKEIFKLKDRYPMTKYKVDTTSNIGRFIPEEESKETE